MRKMILLLATLGLVASSPSWANGYGYHHVRTLHVRALHVRYRSRFAAARRLILGRDLLTPAQLACADIVRGNKAAGQVVQVTVISRPETVCPGSAGSLAPFDLYIDRASGSYQWTPENPGELQEVPYLADLGRRARR